MPHFTGLLITVGLWPIGHGVMQVYGCSMQLGDGRVSGICLCGFHGYAPIRGFVVSHPMPVGRVLVLWFMLC